MNQIQPIILSAVIHKVDNTGGWHYILIPGDTHISLREWAGKKGNIPVKVRLGKTTWSSTTMSMGEQRWFFAIKAEVRAAEKVGEGDQVTVQIEPDFARIK
jgi:hypothetical protein